MSYSRKRLIQRVISTDGKTVAEVRSEVMGSIDANNEVQQWIEVTVSTSSGVRHQTTSHSTADYSYDR
ncbi:hypothetical protein [Phormidesmis sp. 146-33]